MQGRIAYCWVVFTLLVVTASSVANAQTALDELEKQLIGEGRVEEKVAPMSSEQPRGYFGLFTEEQSNLKLGVRIARITPGGPAETAGLRIGDILTGVGQFSLREKEDFALLASRLRPGDKVTVTYLRGGQPSQTELRLTRPPQRVLDTAARQGTQPPNTISSSELMLRIEQLEKRVKTLERMVQLLLQERQNQDKNEAGKQ